MYQVLSIKYRKVFFFLLIFNFSLLTFNLEKAESAFSLAVSPPIIQIEANVPSSIKTPIVIENLSSEPVSLGYELKSFKSSQKENGELVFLNQTPLIFEKIKIYDNQTESKNIELSPLQSKKLNLSIDLPKDEPPSDYYFSIIFSQKDQSDLKENASFAKGAIGVNVLLSIGPKQKAKGTIEEFKVPFFLEKGPVPFTVKIKNDSNYFIAPKGQITIKNMFNQTIGKVDLLPVNILSKTSRFIPSSPLDTRLPREALAKRGGTLGTLGALDAPSAIWPEQFILGPYKATLSISLSEDGPILVKTQRFIGAPIQGLLGLTIAFLIVLLVRSRVKKKLRNP